MRLDMDADQYDESAVVAALALQYGIAAGRLTLSVRGGSLLVTVTIEKQDADPDLMQRLLVVDVAALSSQLGVAVTASAPVALNQTRITPKLCMAGFWCTAGLEIPCERGYYNEHTNANNQSACLPCPAHSTTLSDASTLREHCICDAEFYDEHEGNGVSCKMCPLGTACNTSGTTLGALPLLHGWWRESSHSRDVRQCPDSASDASGCVGGTNNPCKQHLTGPYCRLCNSSGAVLFFYDTQESACRDCDELVGSMGVTWALLCGAAVALLAGLLFGPRLRRYIEQYHTRQLTKWAPLRVWARIVYGTYQILGKVPSIYQLSLPPGVTSAIASITPFIDIGVGGLSATPLECMGLGGFLPQLICYMLLPPITLVLAYPLIALTSEAMTGTTMRARTLQRAERLLPFSLFISFLAFPMVSTQAFRAFVCEEIGTRLFLKADYSVECGSGEDTMIKLWATLAICFYPIGIPLAYALLLRKIRHVVLGNEATHLSESLAFLHRVFKPQFYWSAVSMHACTLDRATHD